MVTKTQLYYLRIVGVILILADFAGFIYGFLTGTIMSYPLMQITLPLGLLGVVIIFYSWTRAQDLKVEEAVDDAASIRFCPRCRHKIDKLEAKFCPNCNYILTE
jgi:hypothetical protein